MTYVLFELFDFHFVLVDCLISIALFDIMAMAYGHDVCWDSETTTFFVLRVPEAG